MKKITIATADAINEALQKSANSAIAKFQANIDAQGHNLTGRLKGSFEKRTTSDANGIQTEILVEDYGRFVDQGVPANRIPYSGRTGRGGRSKYIEGLKDYFIKRGKGSTEALRAAFATAAKHRREGMPTRASYRFSRNGRRTGFIDSEIPGIEADMVQNIERFTSAALETTIFNNFRQLL